MGTSGTVIKNLDLFKNNELLVIHTDNFSNFNLKYLINHHKKLPKYCYMSMLLFKTNKPEQSGIVDINKNKVLVNYYQK